MFLCVRNFLLVMILNFMRSSAFTFTVLGSGFALAPRNRVRLIAKTSGLRMMSDKPKAKYCLNVTLHIAPDRHEDFIRCIKANQAGTLSTEPKARLYIFGRSTTDPNVFHFQEQYEDEAGFKHHTQTPHFKAWEEFANSEGAMLKPPQVDFFEEIF